MWVVRRVWGSRSWLRSFWRWGWAILAVAAFGIAATRGEAYFNQRVFVGGHVVLNRSAALDQAAQAEAAPTSSLLTPTGVDFACYFLQRSDGFVYCGPIYFDLYETQVGYYRYSVSTHKSGGGVAVTVDMSSKVPGGLRAGTRLVAANGEVYSVGKNQDVSVAALADSQIDVALGMGAGSVVWLLVSLVVVWRGRRSPRRIQAPVWAQATWDGIGGLAAAPAVTPPAPVFRPPPSENGARPLVAKPPPSSDGQLDEQLMGEPVALLEAAGWAARAVTSSEVVELEPLGAVVSSRTPGETLSAAHGDSGFGDVDGEGPWWSGPVVLALGPLLALGWAVEPDRKIIKDLAAFLVFHQDRPRSLEEVHAAVWPLTKAKNADGPKDVLLETARQSLSRLRRCVGEEHLADASKAGGYLLAGVASDWLRFEALIEAGRRAPKDRAINLRRQALGLVRGKPFEGVEEAYYGWVFEELWVSTMEKAIVDAAHELSEHCRADGQAHLAGWAAERGLLAVPTDETLHADRMLAALEGSGRPGFDRTWRDVKKVLGDQAESGPLGDLYRRIIGESGE